MRLPQQEFLCWFNHPSIEPEYFGAINMIAPAKSLQAAKRIFGQHSSEIKIFIPFSIYIFSRL